MRVAHAGDADRVEVGAEQQVAPAAGAAGADDDARAPRRRLEDGGVEAGADAQRATNAAIARSPAAPGTSDGLTESISTSADSSATSSRSTAGDPTGAGRRQVATTRAGRP